VQVNVFYHHNGDTSYALQHVAFKERFGRGDGERVLLLPNRLLQVRFEERYEG